MIYRKFLINSYIQGNLTIDEKVECEGYVNLWAFLWKICVGIILIPIYGIGIVILSLVAVRYYTTEIAITNKRVITKSGLLGRSTTEINIDKIESLKIEQSVIGRFLNFGDVVISGAGNQQAKILGVISPFTFRNRFFEIQERK